MIALSTALWVATPTWGQLLFSSLWSSLWVGFDKTVHLSVSPVFLQGHAHMESVSLKWCVMAHKSWWANKLYPQLILGQILPSGQASLRNKAYAITAGCNIPAQSWYFIYKWRHLSLEHLSCYSALIVTSDRQEIGSEPSFPLAGSAKWLILLAN